MAAGRTETLCGRQACVHRGGDVLPESKKRVGAGTEKMTTQALGELGLRCLGNIQAN